MFLFVCRFFFDSEFKGAFELDCFRRPDAPPKEVPSKSFPWIIFEWLETAFMAVLVSSASSTAKCRFNRSLPRCVLRFNWPTPPTWASEFLVSLWPDNTGQTKKFGAFWMISDGPQWPPLLLFFSLFSRMCSDAGKD